MKKILKKYGNTVVITFTSEEMKINGWEEGDILDLSDVRKEGEK